MLRLLFTLIVGNAGWTTPTPAPPHKGEGNTRGDSLPLVGVQTGDIANTCAETSRTLSCAKRMEGCDAVQGEEQDVFEA